VASDSNQATHIALPETGSGHKKNAVVISENLPITTTERDVGTIPPWRQWPSTQRWWMTFSDCQMVARKKFWFVRSCF